MMELNERTRVDGSARKTVPEYLDSWKQIADYFGRDVRTVQYWEKNECLPVWRQKHRRQGRVFAYRSELKSWWTQRCSGPETHRTCGQSEGGTPVSWPGARTSAMAAATEEMVWRPGLGPEYRCKIGRYFWKQRNPILLHKALHHFQAALSNNAQSAAAYAGISDCYVSLSYQHAVPTREAKLHATRASLAAMQADRGSAMSLSARANVLLNFHWDFKGAEVACRQALECDPASEHGLFVYATLLTILRRDQEAVDVALKGWKLHPESAPMSNILAAAYCTAGDYNRAVDMSLRTIELQPDSIASHVRLGRALFEKEEVAQAETALNLAITLADRAPYTLAQLAFLKAIAGQIDVTERLLAEIHSAGERGGLPMVDLAAVHAARGEKTQALQLLTTAMELRDMRALFLRGDLRFKCLYTEAAFRKLIRRIG